MLSFLFPVHLKVHCLFDIQIYLIKTPTHRLIKTKIVNDLQQTLKAKTKYHQIVFDSRPSNENAERASANQSKESIVLPGSRAPTGDSNLVDVDSSSLEEDPSAQMSAPQLEFDSDFESGNLRCAVRVGWGCYLNLVIIFA